MAEAMLLYDEDCGFCRWTLSKVLAWDRRRALRPVPLDSPEADRILAGMSPDQRAASWHLLDPDGRVQSAGAAFPSLFRLLPGGRPLAAVSARAPRLSERGYRFLADRRSRLGRLVTDGAKRRADRRIGERSRREEG
ncbi:MAG TPA: DCC1-like thiol-disulfide oxidoreductase family protein [Solirubrobacterales bacterium]